MVLAGEEGPEESTARHQLPAAGRTSLGLDRREIVRLSDQRFDVGALDRFGERPVEIAEHLPPVHIAILDLVEVSLHM